MGALDTSEKGFLDMACVATQMIYSGEAAKAVKEGHAFCIADPDDRIRNSVSAVCPELADLMGKQPEEIFVQKEWTFLFLETLMKKLIVMRAN